jgi:transposase InsO family protein
LTTIEITINQTIKTTALLDSGSSQNFIQFDLVNKHQLPTKLKEHQLSITLADGHPARGGSITHETKLLDVQIQDYKQAIKFDVLPKSKYPVILGLPWFKAYKPQVDWNSGLLTLPPVSISRSTSAHVHQSDNPQTQDNSSIHVQHLADSSTPDISSTTQELSRHQDSSTPDISSTTQELSRHQEQLRTYSRIQDTPSTPAQSRPDSSILLTPSIPVQQQADSSTLDLQPDQVDSRTPELPTKYNEYASVFNKVEAERLPQERPYDCEIPLRDPDRTPPFLPLYNLSPKEHEALKLYIDDMLTKGFIRPSKSPAGAPIFFVNKADGSLRPCVDYRALNEMTIKNRYPLPLINDLLDKLQGAKVFTKLDLRGAYNLLRMKPGEEWKTAFRSRFGHYEYLVMPFGLTNAPAIFQGMMQDIFRDMLDIYVIIYLDDILIFSPDLETHEQHVKSVLERLRTFGLYCKLEKCYFDQTAVSYLGMDITANGIQMSNDKIQTIQDWTAPTTVKQVQSFLGYTNFYRKFIKNYSAIARPLTDLTKKGMDFTWNNATSEAFTTLKTAITSAPVLRHPDPRLPFIVETDASDFAIGAVLSQPVDNATHPVAFYSRKLLPAELNYTVHDKELLAIVAAFQVWRHYLVGTPHQIQVFSDHRNLAFFQTRRTLKQRHARWAELLSEFDFTLAYRPGHQNPVADALSRRSDLKPEGGDDPHISPAKFETVLLPKSLFANIIDLDLTEAQKLEILQARHDSKTAGHLGERKTYELVARDFHWKGMRRYIKNFVKTCQVCQLNKSSRRLPYGLLKPLPIADRPWNSVSMDFIVKLPTSANFDSIMVVVDRRTKMAHFIPCSETITAAETAQLFLSHVFKLHGLPDSIVSDRGPQFRSAFWKEILKLLKIKPLLSTAYHPETDGQTERINQVLDQYLRCYVDYLQDNWMELLPYAEFAYNNSVHASTGTTPFFANYGFNPRMDLLTSTDSHAPAVTSHLDKLKDISKALDILLELAAAESKRYADKRRLPHEFKIGDQVLLLRRNLKTARPLDKLDHRKLGPYTITEQINDVAFRLDLPSSLKIHNVFHVSLLEKYHANSIPNRIQEPPLPVIIADQEEFEVDQIVDSRKHRGRVQYLVHWKGYSDQDNTWEPPENLTHSAELLQDFHHKYPDKPRVKIDKQSMKGGDDVRNPARSRPKKRK